MKKYLLGLVILFSILGMSDAAHAQQAGITISTTIPNSVTLKTRYYINCNYNQLQDKNTICINNKDLLVDNWGPLLSTIHEDYGANQILVIGKNLGFGVGFVIDGGTMIGGGFTGNSDTSNFMIVDLPTNIAPGPHTIQARQTNGDLSNSISFTVLADPTPIVSSVDITEVHIGDKVTITGKNFATNSEVSLENGGSQRILGNKVISDTKIEFTYPSYICVSKNGSDSTFTPLDLYVSSVGKDGVYRYGRLLKAVTPLEQCRDDSSPNNDSSNNDATIVLTSAVGLQWKNGLFEPYDWVDIKGTGFDSRISERIKVVIDGKMSYLFDTQGCSGQYIDMSCAEFKLEANRSDLQNKDVLVSILTDGKHTIQTFNTSKNELSNSLDINIVANHPIIAPTTGFVVAPGGSITLSGKNFHSDSVVEFGVPNFGVFIYEKVVPTSVTSSSLTFTVPSDALVYKQPGDSNVLNLVNPDSRIFLPWLGHVVAGIPSNDVGVIVTSDGLAPKDDHNGCTPVGGCKSGTGTVTPTTSPITSPTTTPINTNNTALPTSISIVSPKINTTWKKGSSQYFKWSSNKVPVSALGYIALTGSDGVLRKIVSDIPNTGSYIWKSVGLTEDNSLVPSNLSPYSITVVMNNGGTNVFNLEDRTVSLSDTSGNTEMDNTVNTTLPSPNTAPTKNILKYGSRNEFVSTLQQYLHDGGYLKVNPTGYFGSLTRQAVKAFQRAHGLSVDGVVGPKTKEKVDTTPPGPPTGPVTETPPTTTTLPLLTDSTQAGQFLVNSDTVLQWFTKNATSCTANGTLNGNPISDGAWSGSKPVSTPRLGDGVVRFTQAGEYVLWLNCTGPAGSANLRIGNYLVSNPANAPAITASVSPTTIFASKASDPDHIKNPTDIYLTWTSTNATSCGSSAGPAGLSGTSGTTLIYGISDPIVGGYYYFGLSCTGPAGVMTRFFTFPVTEAPLVTATLSASPTSVPANQKWSILWSSTGATSCTGGGNFWNGEVLGLSGSKEISGGGFQSAGTTVPFNITCKAPGRSVTKEASISFTAVNE